MTIYKQFKHNINETADSLTEIQKSGKRFYSTPDGEFPSVTTVVGYGKQNFFAEWRRKNPEESRRVLSRGTKLHSLIESYLNNETLDFDNMLPNFKVLFNQIKPELDKIQNIVAIETPLWSKTLGLAGRTDCIAEWNGKLSVIDFKTSRKEKRKEWIESYFMQCTAYAIMFEEMTGIPVPQIVVAISVEGYEPQIYIEKRDNYAKQLLELRLEYERFSKLYAV